MDMRDRFRGCLLGGAIGDALGYPIEFMDLSEIRHHYGEDGLTDLLIDPLSGKALFSDDTQMTLFTASGLLNASMRIRSRGIGSFVASGVYPAYLRWLYTQTGESPRPFYLKPTPYERDGQIPFILDYKELFASRAPGNTCLFALASGKIGTTEAPLNNSKGCGGVMRIAPVGLAFAKRAQTAYQRGTEIAAITHGHPSGYHAAAVLSVFVSVLARGESILQALSVAERQLLVWCGIKDAEKELLDEIGYDAFFQMPEYYGRDFEEVYRAISKAIALSESDTSPEQAIEELGGGWVGEEALAIGLYCVLKEPDFKKALLMSVNHSGDTDSTGTICGNLLGALHGMSSIPKDWVEKIEANTFIIKMADCLFEHFVKLIL